MTATAVTTCPPWCTDHETWADGTEYHQSGTTLLAGAMIDMNTGTIEGDPRIFGLQELGGRTRECITLDDAETLAYLLLGLVAAARSTR